ncbi:hypothetical protein [Serpentinicella alkaliphila]|uniref:hypothetical protein n=1 Tax=Serpentinicella alkaliphila TaxID=1734049 RepID=UPI001044BB4A|nr:hypothetical protein [Serpentinicella alkaliphila]
MWHLGETQELNVVIIDKTVPDNTYREHKALVWLLSNQKITKPKSGEFYQKHEDYYGYFPDQEQENRIRKLQIEDQKFDLIYVADTYGVYEEDIEGQNIAGKRSELIYGGINMNEVEILRRAAYKGTIVVAEFNTFGSPTGTEAKEALYDLLGLRWTGWIGRYFQDLSPDGEVPDWAVSNYESQQGRPWSYYSGGFIFVSSDDKVVVIKEEDNEKQGVDFCWTTEGEDFIGKSGSYPYHYWFDIIEPAGTSTVLAEYDLSLTESGKKKLEAEGIPQVFPAVIQNNTGLYSTYYFAGDYADNENTPAFYKVAGLTTFMEKTILGKTDAFFWKAYVPLVKKIIAEASLGPSERDIPKGFILPSEREKDEQEGTKLVSRTHGEHLQIFNNGQWQDFFVKGVNLGIALPGRWFTNFPKQESLYLEWFEDIGKMNVNTIRVYTLMDPSFYRALLRYNVQHAESPIWLLQEIWPEEHPPGNDYLREAYTKEFFKEIEHTIDAVHGNIQIPHRSDRAYGRYDADVSPYILGFLVGRELEPEEVIATDENNNVTAFEGKYLVISEGSPTEVWLAKSCEHVLAYQDEVYGWQHPVAFVSWPTLDVMEHDGEWNEAGDKQLEYNDRVSIDIRHFFMGARMKAGFFGAYHIYPNYPDFMNNTLGYSNYTDDKGVFRYGGYLRHFMEHHAGYPALVAEFGLATGMGNAHENPDGYNHGGMTEEEQGYGVVRMMEAIHREGYAGGVIFEWMDEWAKKTWTTEAFMVPYEHNVFWHNTIDPEQNYGILAMEAIRPEKPQAVLRGNRILQRLELSGNESYLYLSLYTDGPLDLEKQQLLIGLDTYDAKKGIRKYRENIDLRAPSGLEFLVTLAGKKGSLEVIPEYNIERYNFASVPNSQGPFETMNPIINSQRVTKDGRKIDQIREEASLLRQGPWFGQSNHWYQEENVIYIRIPWGRLNVTDPTTYQVLDDPREFFDYPPRDTFKTAVTEGFRVTTLLLNKEDDLVDMLPSTFDVEPEPFKWESWSEPRYKKRLKESYYILQRYFENMKRIRKE